MRLRFVFALVATLIIAAMFLWQPVPSNARVPSIPSTEEVRNAYDYAAWCGGVVTIEPLPHNSYDIITEECDR